MAERLTDGQKKMIIADFVELGSYNAVAKKHGIADSTVKRAVLSDEETKRRAERKKKQNTLDMLAYMDDRKGKAQTVIDAYLDALADPEKLERATLAQIATALGILVDKFVGNTQSGDGSIHKLDELLKEFKDAVKPEAD